MNNQEIFDRVARHLLQQREQARERHGLRSCRYRVKVWPARVLKCAVGCLIPEEVYNKFPALEGKTVVQEPVISALITAGLPVDPETDTICEDTMTLLISLQDMHDISPPKDWRDQLGLLAASRDLSPAVLEEIDNE